MKIKPKRRSSRSRSRGRNRITTRSRSRARYSSRSRSRSRSCSRSRSHSTKQRSRQSRSPSKPSTESPDRSAIRSPMRGRNRENDESDRKRSKAPARENLQNDSRWMWINSGRKKRKNGYRTYYRCADFDCDAKKYLDSSEHSSKTSVSFHGDHNHEIPKARIKPSTSQKQEVDTMIKAGLGPNTIHKKITLSSPAGTSIMSVQSIKNHSAYLRSKARLSRETAEKIGGFLLKEVSGQNTMYICCTKKALGRLSRSIPYAFIDGTFNLCEGGLVLTTLMTKEQGIGYPAAFMLSGIGNCKIICELCVN